MAARAERGTINWLYAAPALALMAAVNLVPILQTFQYASEFGRLSADAQLKRVLWNTATFTFWSVSLELLLGLAMALLLIRPFKGRGAVRAAVLIPWALPTAIMAMAWRWILNSEYGVLGHLLYKFGLSSTPNIPWLASPGHAMAAAVMADVWKTAPFMAILLMSGLAAISQDLYEALAVVFRAIQAFGIFDLIYVLTGGGPGGRTQTIALYVYDTVFRYQELGYGSALTLVMAGCLMALAAVVLYPSRSRA
jgi:multiple sugar transport system permease protein